MVSVSMVPCATLMVIGSAGARLPLFNAGWPVTTATGGTGGGLVALTALLIAGAALVAVAVPDVGEVVPGAAVTEAALLSAFGEPVEQPAARTSRPAIDPTIHRRG